MSNFAVKLKGDVAKVGGIRFLVNMIKGSCNHTAITVKTIENWLNCTRRPTFIKINHLCIGLAVVFGTERIDQILNSYLTVAGYNVQMSQYRRSIEESIDNQECVIYLAWTPDKFTRSSFNGPSGVYVTSLEKK